MAEENRQSFNFYECVTVETFLRHDDRPTVYLTIGGYDGLVYMSPDEARMLAHAILKVADDTEASIAAGQPAT